MKKTIYSFLVLTILFVACKSDKKEDTKGDSKETTSMENKGDRNKKVVMASVDNFLKGDYDAAFKDASPGFVDYTDGSMPPITNLDTLKSTVKMMTASFENYKAENMQYYADGDHVFLIADWTGVFKKDLMGMKATGKPFKYKDVDIFKLNDDGKITEHSSVQNVGAVLMASGMMK